MTADPCSCGFVCPDSASHSFDDEVQAHAQYAHDQLHIILDHWDDDVDTRGAVVIQDSMNEVDKVLHLDAPLRKELERLLADVVGNSDTTNRILWALSPETIAFRLREILKEPNPGGVA